MAGKTSLLPFNAENLETVEKILHDATAASTPRFYEIAIDENVIVPRTTNLELFDKIHDNIRGDSQTVKISLFQGNSFHRENYIFFTRENPGGLAGFQARQNQGKSNVPSSHPEDETEFLEEKKKRKKLKKAHKKLLSYSEELEKKVDDLENHRLTLGSLISAGLDGLVRSNTGIIRQFGRGGETLAGLIEADTQARQAELNSTKSEEGSPSQNGVHFEREKESTKEATEEEKVLLQTVRSILERFNEKQHKEVNGIIRFIAEHPETISDVLVHLGKLEESMKEEDDEDEDETTENE